MALKLPMGLSVGHRGTNCHWGFYLQVTATSEASMDLHQQLSIYRNNISPMLANMHRLSNLIPERSCLLLKLPLSIIKTGVTFFSFRYFLAGSLALSSFKILTKVLITEQYASSRTNENQQ